MNRRKVQAKCDPDAGWKRGPRGKCVRADPKDKGAERRKARSAAKSKAKGLPPAQGAAFFAVIGAAWAASLIDKTNIAKAEIHLAKFGRKLSDKELSLVSEEDFSRIKIKQKASTQGEFGDVSLVEIDGKPKILKEQPDPDGPETPIIKQMMGVPNREQKQAIYAYSASIESTVSRIAEDSGIPIAKSALIPSEVTTKARGVPRMGATLIDVAEGEEIWKTDFAKGKLFNFQMAPPSPLSINQLKAMSDPDVGSDAAKLMAFDTFIGNPDRHGANIFLSEDENGKKRLTGIDQGMSFLSDQPVASLLQTMKETKKAGSTAADLEPEDRKGLEAYVSALEDLIKKNPPKKTKKRFLSYALKETGPQGRSGFGEQMTRVMTINSNYDSCRRLVKEMREYLGSEGQRKDSLLDNEYALGYLAGKGIEYSGGSPAGYLYGYLQFREDSPTRAQCDPSAGWVRGPVGKCVRKKDRNMAAGALGVAALTGGALAYGKIKKQKEGLIKYDPNKEPVRKAVMGAVVGAEGAVKKVVRDPGGVAGRALRELDLAAGAVVAPPLIAALKAKQQIDFRKARIKQKIVDKIRKGFAGRQK